MALSLAVRPLAQRLRRALPTILASAALLCLLLAGVQVHEAWRMQRWNADLQRGVAEPDAPPMLLFARAYALETRGDWEAALRAYGEAEPQADAALRRAIHINAANILLRRAAALSQKEGWTPQATTLVELAKRGYREVLRTQPDDWPTRYNLELAQLFVADRQTSDEQPEGSDVQVGESNGEDELGWSDMIGALKGTH